MRIFEMSVDLGEDGIVTRTIKADSDKAALRLMQAKFPPHAKISVESSRLQTEEEREEEHRLRFGLDRENARAERVRLNNRQTRGAALCFVGLVSSYFTYDHDWLIYPPALATVIGVIEFFRARKNLNALRDQSDPNRRFSNRR